ncbi:hypothetical protein VFPPC_18334 [Pochonia chlamydosporia 170]|uniref:Secreted protein n=1 Tax=Pochonia chlamydosporia 170 TaxID=1380566 RepID=A0A219APP4_METCM|nr:hypothetical protein VFPPC_18334 [Pochonia chlamydosporia 170]OWT42532.1 hypothetical protein VFPPC_18334 [Pochonia chlamydosporia 170]
MTQLLFTLVWGGAVDGCSSGQYDRSAWLGSSIKQRWRSLTGEVNPTMAGSKKERINDGAWAASRWTTSQHIADCANAETTWPSSTDQMARGRLVAGSRHESVAERLLKVVLQ